MTGWFGTDGTGERGAASSVLDLENDRDDSAGAENETLLLLLPTSRLYKSGLCWASEGGCGEGIFDLTA